MSIRWLFWGACVLILTGCGDRDDMPDLQQFVADQKRQPPVTPLPPLPEIQPYYPVLYTVAGLKDPFMPGGFVRTALLAQPATPNDSGIRPNPDRPREELERYNLSALKMVGTVGQEGRIWGLIKAPDGIVYRVKTGNYMGTDHGQVVKVSQDRIDLVELVKDAQNQWIKHSASLSIAE